MAALRLLVLLLLAWSCGCAREPSLALDRWTVEAAGSESMVTVPGRLELPPRELPVTLRTTVALPAWARGAPASLILPAWGGVESVAIDGERVEPLESPFRYAAPAEPHAIPIPPSAAEDGTVTIAVHVACRSGAAARLSWVPRIAPGPRGDRAHLLARAFNTVTTRTAMVVLVLVGLLHALVFAVDRRNRAYGLVAAAMFGTALVVASSFGISVFPPSLRFIDYSVAFLNHWVVLVTLFELCRLPQPRALRWAPALLVVPWSLGHDAFTFPRLHQPAVMLLTQLLVIAGLVLAVRHRRRLAAGGGTLVVGSILAPLVGMHDAVTAIFGHEVFPGVRLSGLSYTIMALTLAVTLAREHHSLRRSLEQRISDLDAANRELRYQVAERSRALASTVSISGRPTAVGEGVVIGERYRVVRRLGAGGMGEVHEVERITDARRFALKVLTGAASPDAMSRFMREAQIAAEVHDEHLVGVVDVGVSSGGLAYVVMELVSGGSLEAYRERFGDRAWALDILRQVAVGLDALHRAGVIHRDLKPGNVLIDEGGRVRIADFGIAAVLRDLPRDFPIDALASTEGAGRAARLTRTGALLGTPSYMAPELARGAEHASAASDVFAFAVMACELLTGRSPFGLPALLQALAGHRLTPVEPPTDGAIGELLAHALREFPAERPTLAELRATL